MLWTRLYKLLSPHDTTPLFSISVTARVTIVADVVYGNTCCQKGNAPNGVMLHIILVSPIPLRGSNGTN